MTEIKVSGFGNRNGDDAQPFGFINFTDGKRICWAPGADSVDGYGLQAECQQPYGVQGDLTEAHILAARAYVTEHLVPLQEMARNLPKIKATGADVERVWSSAMKTKDRYDPEGFISSDDHETLDLLIEFCDLLMGRGAKTVDSFLSNNDLEIPQ